MKCRYFSVNEIDVSDALPHIGTITGNDNNQLKNKLQEACISHFDCDCAVLDVVDFNKIKYGRSLVLSVLVDGGNKTQIEVFETWIY